MPVPGTFERLLQSAAGARAWVAEDVAGEVVSHVIFAPAVIEAASGAVNGFGLGELAVLPALQRQGIGTLLGNTTIAALRADGCPFVIVVGHAAYYPRFGFRPAGPMGLRCQWGKVPDENFMALVLDTTTMRGVSGVARFCDVA